MVGRGRSHGLGWCRSEHGRFGLVEATATRGWHDRHRRRCPWPDRRHQSPGWCVSPSRARGSAHSAWPRPTPGSYQSRAKPSGPEPAPRRWPAPGRQGGLSMAECRAAFYARVSSEAQARDHTISSHVAALRERITADAAVMDPDHAFIDEGHSGSSLVRPALERLRDAVAAGDIDRLYLLAP